MDVRDRRFAILFAFAAIVVQLPGLFWGVPGGKAINNALRILDGEVPYRDFWTMYAPGHFYVVALLFKIFGVHVAVQGLASQAFVAADAAILFVITRRLGLSRRHAVLVGTSFVAMQWGTRRELSSYETALLPLLLALDRVVCYAQGRGARRLIVAGLLCGIGAWFKHDVAFYVAGAIIVGLSAGWFLRRDRRPAGWVSPAGILSRVVIGALIAALPIVVLLAWKAGPDAWHDLIVFPATDFRVVRGEQYPRLIPPWRRMQPWLRDPHDLRAAQLAAEAAANWLQANVPQLVFIAGLVGVARRRKALDPTVLALSAVSLAAMPFFWASAHVQQNTNFRSLWIFSVLLGTSLWIGRNVRFRQRAAAACLFLLLTGSFFVAPVGRAAEVVYFWRDHETMPFPSAAGVRISRKSYDIYQPIVSFVRQHVPDSEPIYVGVVRHDAVVISDQSFYYLAGRRVASRYNELHPGFADREDIQREIIRDLNRLQVRCAVLWEFGWPKPVLDDIVAFRQRHIPELGSTVLDEFLRREFEQVARYGEYILVWRKGVPLPRDRAS
jgi:hypothetical protein